MSNKFLNFISRFGIFFILIPLIFFTIRPLIQPGFFSMHDDEQIGRLYDLHQTIHDGQFPVRVTSNLGFGYGYMLFNFYPPFVYYFADIFKEIGFSYLVSEKIMMFFGFVFSWMFMYLFAKQYWGKLGAVLSATAYLYAPYHAVDIYVRGAIPEFWAFVFVPALFWSLKKLRDELSINYVLLSGIFGALLMLTHNLVALMTAPFILIYFLYLAYQLKKRRGFILLTGFSALLSGLLSAFFFIPAIFERGNTMVNLLTIERASYLLHFVCARQFVFSSWGYSGSVAGCLDGMSFSLGQIHILLLLVSVLFFVRIFIKKNKKYPQIFLIFILLFAISLFIQTIHSGFIWNKISVLSYIQFPWRFLLISSFALSFLLGIIPNFFKNKKMSLFLTLVAMLAIVVFNKDFFKPEKQFINKTDQNYINEKYIKWYTSSLAFEYVPNGIKTKKTKFETTGIAINENQIRQNVYTVLRGDIKAVVIDDESNYKQLALSSKKGAVLRFNTFTFPGWEVKIDYKNIDYSDNNDLKLITINVPAGLHLVELSFNDTPIRKFSNTLSIIGFLIVIILIIASFLKVKIKLKYIL